MGMLIAYLLGILTAVNPKDHNGSGDSLRSVPAPHRNIQELVADDKTKSDEREYRVQNSIRWAAWCAFTAAAFYGGIAALQWWDLRRNFKLDQRPWIAIREQAIILNQDRMDAQITFINSGRTPARNVQKSVEVKLAPAPSLDKPPDADIKNLAFGGHSVLGPQATFRAIAGTTVEADQRLAVSLKQAIANSFQYIDSGQSILYVFGEIKYEDVSGESHMTNYCFHAVKIQSGWYLAECREFNEMN
jgi:hypothetical protein